MPFSIIAAIDEKNGLGKNNKLAWYLPADLKHFAKITTTGLAGQTNAVIMGRNTWLSLPKKFQPLPGRLNVVLTSQLNFQKTDQVLFFASLDKALDYLNKKKVANKIFIIGGGHLYAKAVEHPDCHKLYITKVSGDFNCDIFFPKIPDDFKLISESRILKENGIKFKYQIYEK